MTAVAPPAPAPPTRHHPSGAAPALIGGVVVVLVVVVALMLIAGTSAIVTAATKTTAKPACPQVATCLAPGHTTGPDHTQTFTEPTYGYSFQYPSTVDKVSESDGRVTVEDDHGAVLFIEAAPTSRINAETAFESQRNSDADANQNNLDSVDTTSMNRLVAPSIGFVPGVGGSYNGTLQQSRPINESIMAASNGKLTVVIIVIVLTQTARDVNDLRSEVGDLITDSFQWPS